MDFKPKRMRHDYTNEVELKSLLIREKNRNLSIGSLEKNSIIDTLITQYKDTKDSKLKNDILNLSKITQSSQVQHERFGEIILLMIKKILTKPNFSGYSWQDEFYSTACYRVFKYLHNFDFEKKSNRTNAEVSAFSYITQIISMSILEVINKNNKNSKELSEYMEKCSEGLEIYKESKNSSTFENAVEIPCEIIIDYEFESLSKALQEILNAHDTNLNIYYPKDYFISYDEYAEISSVLKGYKHTVSLIKLELDSGKVL